MAPVTGFFRLIFVYVEPILTFGGAYASYVSPEWFLTRSIPGPTKTGLVHTTETIMAVKQYGVLLFLLGMISMSVFGTIGNKSDPLAMSVARRLLFVLAVADVVHMHVTTTHLGWEIVKDVRNWNDLTWGNIGITLFLLVSRIFWFILVGMRSSTDDKKVR